MWQELATTREKKELQRIRLPLGFWRLLQMGTCSPIHIVCDHLSGQLCRHRAPLLTIDRSRASLRPNFLFNVSQTLVCFFSSVQEQVSFVVRNCGFSGMVCDKFSEEL